MEKVISTLRGKSYKVNDAIRILNPKQAQFYWSRGLQPLDIYLQKDFKNDEPIIVYIFSRSQTQETGIYDEWCRRKDKNM